MQPGRLSCVAPCLAQSLSTVRGFNSHSAHNTKCSSTSAVLAASNATKAAIAALGGARPGSALVFDCVATHVRLGKAFGDELDACAQLLQPAGFVGCNTYGPGACGSRRRAQPREQSTGTRPCSGCCAPRGGEAQHAATGRAPPQGRISGHARPRVAQSTRPTGHLGRDPEANSRRIAPSASAPVRHHVAADRTAFAARR